MTRVNVDEAKTQLSRLLALVAAGEEIILTDDGKPVAKMVPVNELPRERAPGTASGMISISENFNEPLPSSILETFEQ